MHLFFYLFSFLPAVLDSWNFLSIILLFFFAFLKNIASSSFPLTCYFWLLELLLAICGNRVWWLVLPSIWMSIPSRAFGWLYHWLRALGRLPGNLSWPSRVTECEAEVMSVISKPSATLQSLFFCFRSYGRGHWMSEKDAFMKPLRFWGCLLLQCGLPWPK